jgi:hypothetical protein
MCKNYGNYSDTNAKNPQSWLKKLYINANEINHMAFSIRLTVKCCLTLNRQREVFNIAMQIEATKD